MRAKLAAKRWLASILFAGTGAIIVWMFWAPFFNQVPLPLLIVNSLFLTAAVIAIALTAGSQQKAEIGLAREQDEREQTNTNIRTVLDSAYDSFIAMNSDGRIIAWNSQAEATFGWTRAEVIGKNLADIIVPERFRGAHTRGLKHLLKTGEGPVLKKRVNLDALHRDGREFPVEITISAGKVEGRYTFGAFLRDTTTASKVARLQEVQLAVTRIFAESASLELTIPKLLETICRGLGWHYAGYWEIDSKCDRIQLKTAWHSSPEFARFAKTSSEYRFAAGQGFPGKVWQANKALWITDIANDTSFVRSFMARQLGFRSSIAFPVWGPTEGLGVIEFFSQKLVDFDPQTVGVMTDLGTRFGIYIQRIRADEGVKASEERLKKLNEELEARVEERTAELTTTIAALEEAKANAESANRAKSDFLANMSHEIRTPLGAVIGFSELVVSQRLSPEERADYVSAIKRNGELLSNIISDILDLSKVEAGKLTIDKQVVPLTELLTDLTTFLNLQAQERGLTLTVQSIGTVPEQVKTDALRLRQILNNVVGNAIKFTQRGGVEVTVRLQSDDPDLLVFEVKDTGRGIAADQISKLFKPFSQADASSKRKFGGTGLGLALSKRLAKILGGDLVLKESSVGVGSTFVISVRGAMPVTKQDEQRVAASQTAISAQGNQLDGVRVLLVEDAPDNRMLISRFLKIAGADVEAVENGVEALKIVAHDSFDVILMDLQMPVMDGYEATAELRRQRYIKPIIALTAHALKEERLRCLASGFDDHLGKPVDRSALIDCVSTHASLGRRPSTRHPEQNAPARSTEI
jgi:PAS domain S-box-containing protein